MDTKKKALEPCFQAITRAPLQGPPLAPRIDRAPTAEFVSHSTNTLHVARPAGRSGTSRGLTCERSFAHSGTPTGGPAWCRLMTFLSRASRAQEPVTDPKMPRRAWRVEILLHR